LNQPLNTWQHNLIRISSKDKLGNNPFETACPFGENSCELRSISMKLQLFAVLTLGTFLAQAEEEDELKDQKEDQLRWA
jgi:hypothetical protein